MRKLIADAVVADGIEILVKEVPLFSPEFEEKIGALATDEAKASEMEHAIRHEISVHVEENPAFYQSLRERLEALIEERRSSPPATMPATATSLPISMRQSHDPPPAPREFVSGESVLYLGRHYRLKVSAWPGNPRRRGASIAPSAATMPRPQTAPAPVACRIDREALYAGVTASWWCFFMGPGDASGRLGERLACSDGGGVVRRWERVLPCPRRGRSANRRQRPA